MSGAEPACGLGDAASVTVTDEQVRNGLAIFVAFVWGGAVLASVITAKYEVLAAVTPVMTIVAGFLFGYRRPSSKPGNGSPPRSQDLSDW